MDDNTALLTLVERWEDRREIQNLMGRYTYALLLEETEDCFERFWARREDVCYGTNNGWHLGEESIRNYYKQQHDWVQLRSRAIRECFPEETKDIPEEKIYGLGSLNEHPLCNQIIEIADDGQTAKGFWYANGIHIDANAHGPLSYWVFGMYVCDFIRGDDGWRIWHMQYLEEIKTPGGYRWEKPFVDERPVSEAFRPLERFEWRQPDVPETLREYYSEDRAFLRQPRYPEPYDTFENTFSYGYSQSGESA